MASGEGKSKRRLGKALPVTQAGWRWGDVETQDFVMNWDDEKKYKGT